MKNPRKMITGVRSHQRRLPSGKVVRVKKHTRGLTISNTPFPNKQGTFHLPVRTAIIVPSTTDKNKPVSKSEMARRVAETRKFLSDTNGGYTSVKAVGGYTDESGRVIKEPVLVVESYSTKKGFLQNRKKVRDWLESKGSQWKQEAMGYEHEDDLWYVDSKKNSSMR